jgi:phosphatidylinositol alpha-mannosyltransferase
MRVCIVVPYDLAEEGGVKRHAQHLATSLRRLGDDVTIMGASSEGQHAPDVHVFGGVINIRSNGSDNRVAVLTAPWRIRRWLHDGAFDVVHVHEPLCPLLACWASVFSGGSARVATFHAFAEHEEPTRRFMRWCAGPLVLNGFDRAIAVSRPAEEYARFVWKRDLVIIPNGVPTETFHETPQRAAQPREPIRLLFVGNWRDARKGLPTLLAAVAQLRDRGTTVMLAVVGKGPDGATPPNIPDVRFHGSLTSEEAIAERLRACDIFVAPSTGQESFGIVLLEAMASGCPIICTDIAGYRQVVTRDHARMVAPGSVEELANAIEGLARDPVARREMGKRNRQRAELFDWERIGHRVRDEYVAAIEDARRDRCRPRYRHGCGYQA